MSINDTLVNIYFDVSNPASFGGVKKLYNAAKAISPEISFKNVQDWLKTQLTYTLHKQIINKFKRNRILVQRKNEQFECDLVDMQNFSKFNSGFKYILTAIDCFSKFLYAFPLKNKTPFEIIKVFKVIFKIDKPQHIRTDRGLEFNNSKVQKFLKENDVNYFTSNDSKIKCAIMERANRTLKSKMFRYFTSKGTRKYYDILQALVKSYNNSYHRTIKMAPINVSDANREEVFENIYQAKNYREIFEKAQQKSKLKVGSTVRIKYDLNKNFDKSYYPLWSDRIYKIEKKIDRSVIPNFEVSSEGDTLKRKFYPKELQEIAGDPIYRIEKILRKRQRNGEKQVLVKYIGYPDQYNQWIQQASLINMKKDGSKAVPVQARKK